MQLKTVAWTRDVIDLSTLSALFVEFYQAEPWNEYLLCPRCKPADDFGPAHTWGAGNAPADRRCPECGNELELFWGPNRVEGYLFGNPDNEGLVGLLDGKPACWIMGRPTAPGMFYIDVIAIMKEFRIRPGFQFFLDRVFQPWKTEMLSKGYVTFRARSHKEAKNVHLLFRILGFKRGQDSEEDPDRSYWTLTVTRQLAC